MRFFFYGTLVAGSANRIAEAVHATLTPAGEMTWKLGPNLPRALSAAVVIPYANTFLVAGGLQNGKKDTDRILEFSSLTKRWVERTERLKLARNDAMAIKVPDSYCK